MHEDLYRLSPCPDREPFWVSLAGISYCDGTYLIFRPPTTETTVIEYVSEGYGTIQVDDRSCRPGPGDLYILPWKRKHLYFADPSAPWTKYFFNIEGSLIPQMLTQYGLDDTPVVAGTGALPLFKEGLDLIKKGNAQPEQLQDQLGLIIHRIIAVAARASRRAPDDLPEDVRKVKEYVAANPAGKISLEDLVAISGRGRSQLNRDFKRCLNTTPYSFLLMHRLEQARLLLKNTRRPIKEIAFELGFTDEYHFSNFFKKKAGVSPKTFRLSRSDSLQTGYRNY